MKQKLRKLLSSVLPSLPLVGILGIAIWRARREGAIPEPPKPEQPAPIVEQGGAIDLPWLAGPGETPLDHLARQAAAENVTDPESLKSQAAEPATVEEVLRNQNLESRTLEGWSEPEPRRLPMPTYAPAVMAFGIVVFALGLATIWYVCLAGAVVFAVAAWLWVGELEGE